MFSGFENFCAEESKYGVDKLAFMVRLVKMLDDDSPSAVDDLQTWLENELGRELTREECLNMARGLLHLVKSEEGSQERVSLVDGIINLEFLNEES